jgi:hypothetical protein
LEDVGDVGDVEKTTDLFSEIFMLFPKIPMLSKC